MPHTGTHSGLQLFTQSTLAVDVEVVAHEPPISEQTEPPSLLAAGEDLMSIVANLGVLDALFVVLPEPLNASCAFVPIPQIVTPCALNSSSHIVPVAISHSLQCEELRKV